MVISERRVGGVKIRVNSADGTQMTCYCINNYDVTLMVKI